MAISNSKLAICLACIMALAMAGHTVAQSSPDDYVNAHNSARSEVGVGPVTWNDTVAAYAQNYANQRANDCQLIHSNGPYGENLFWGSGADYSGVDAVNAWVSEKQDYDYNSNTCAEGKVCGHYTQVVWSNSINIGCALVVCNNNAGIFIICSYFPAGNIDGERPY
ncbi:pathogenesis-related protein 1-like [Dioscorea cayenensis subsp. rotundata]|uniref:Pathogenesis-related protein 1-like n=1 Tax=Dioscorea cayennensis subsp. rotundata TaxID=55577 RepID=A0AB40BUX9_DIOCR|nr:pathogenesis-related protein 1-like [Dioscorea cayenensis subsp. rotundata]